MKQAIMRYLKQEKHAEQLKHETLSRWVEAEQGKVVNHDAMFEWLDSWGSESESDRPKCGR